MIVGIHQPNHLPYLGFFDKMMQSDIFIIYDDAQFNQEDFQHRNKIRIYHDWKYLTVPIEKKLIPINEIKIKNEVTLKKMKWSDAHIRDIRDNYNKTPFYTKYINDVEKIYANKYDKLIDLNLDIIHFIMNAFNIRTTIVLSSEFGFTSKSTEKLVELVEAVDGDVYLSGPSGRNYLDFSAFEKKRIQLKFQDFKHPVYEQYYTGFIPNMASIDALFNLGVFPEKKDFIL
jgi:hypothetical protein